MSKKKNNNRHANILKPSDPDTVALSAAVESRFLDLCGSYRRIRGVDLVPPPDLDGDMLRWRTMVVRHKGGDFRNTDDEKISVRYVAQWTLDVQCRLRDQEPQTLEWKD